MGFRLHDPFHCGLMLGWESRCVTAARQGATSSGGRWAERPGESAAAMDSFSSPSEAPSSENIMEDIRARVAQAYAQELLEVSQSLPPIPLLPPIKLSARICGRGLRCRIRVLASSWIFLVDWWLLLHGYRCYGSLQISEAANLSLESP
jgi:hypothetical protein